MPYNTFGIEVPRNADDERKYNVKKMRFPMIMKER